MRPTELERASTILALASIPGPNGEWTTERDQQLADEHGVSLRSIQRWRANLATDRELASRVASKRLQLESKWLQEVPFALQDVVQFVRKAAKDGDHKDPEMVRAMAGAAKLLSEQLAMHQMLNARSAAATRPAPATDRPVVSPGVVGRPAVDGGGATAPGTVAH